MAQVRAYRTFVAASDIVHVVDLPQDVVAARGAGPKVVDDFSLHIRPGKKIGLVGRSDAGKSALVNLLLRFHDLEQGRVLIDGQDASQKLSSKRSERRQFGAARSAVALKTASQVKQSSLRAGVATATVEPVSLPDRRDTGGHYIKVGVHNRAQAVAMTAVQSPGLTGNPVQEPLPAIR